MPLFERSLSRLGKGLILACSLLLAGTGHTQGQSADSQRIIDALKPAPAPALKTRSLRNLNVEQTGETASQSSAPKFVSLTIGFQFNSSQITPESASTLATLAQALKSDELGTLSFMVEGHTDGKGTPEYNLKLSQQRAASVKTYLVQAGVDAKRLQSQGKGDTELVNAQDRFAAENRRVKVIALMP